MKTTKKLIRLMLPIFTVILFFNSCDSDKIGDNFKTFDGKTLGQYLEENDEYSEFSKLLEHTQVLGLLKSYGKYTCFAPTNEAVKKFCDSKGKESILDFTADTLKLIAFDHLISGNIINYAGFNDGVLTQKTMSDKDIAISFKNSGNTYVNDSSLILTKDIEVHNGIVHKIDRMIEPVRAAIIEVIANDGKFTLFYEALIATGLDQLLLPVEDESFVSADHEDLISLMPARDWAYYEIPASRKYGFTVLMESDSTFNANGISDVESMRAYAKAIYDETYPQDAHITDITNRKNSLNRFIAYHLFDKKLNYNTFIMAYDVAHQNKTYDLFEYIETMCPNTLMEVKIDRYYRRNNLLNYLPETEECVEIFKNNSDRLSENGIYHEINNILAYTKTVDAMVSSKRLRFDASASFPEMTNNNMRGLGVSDPSIEKQIRFVLPKGYLDRLEIFGETPPCYCRAHPSLMNYHGDEIFALPKTGTLYNFTLTTLPVPEGGYEVRVGFNTGAPRGVVQFYVDGIPAGVPVDLNVGGSDAGIGYVKPGSEPEDSEGYENDKMMRNRGYMKGPNSFKAINTNFGYSTESARATAAYLRKILGTYTFKEASTHTIQMKGLSGGQFIIDFIEFVPTSVLEFEDIY